VIEDRNSEIEKKEEKIRNIGFLITLLIVVALLPIGFKFYSLYNTKKAIYQAKQLEEKKLQAEVEKLQKKTEDLKETEKFLKTKEGAERVARDKLGLTKPNEIPLVIKKTNSTEEECQPETEKKEKQKPDKNSTVKSKKLEKNQ
jgi:cell division protein DivIC